VVFSSTAWAANGRERSTARRNKILREVGIKSPCLSENISAEKVKTEPYLFIAMNAIPKLNQIDTFLHNFQTSILAGAAIHPILPSRR
jgi:hypothetical protein